MPNVMRWRYGARDFVSVPTSVLSAIEAGDLVYLVAGVAHPASYMTDAGTLFYNQFLFHDMFLGVAMTASPLGSTVNVRVGTTGVFEFDCASATFEVGALVGPTENVAGNALLPGSVIAVADQACSIGRVARHVGTAATKVQVEIRSSIMRGDFDQPQTVSVATNTADVIAVGDMLYLASGVARVASAQAIGGSLAASQETFHDAFLGIALQAKASGSTAAIRIATTGIWEFGCASTSFALGALVGIIENGGRTALIPQSVAGVATPNLATGRVAVATTSATTVRVQIASTVLTGGPQASL